MTADQIQEKGALPKVSLILDASTLMEMAKWPPQDNAPRSLIDLLPLIASLPNVGRIYIPAFIADWELRGGVTVAGENGSAVFKPVDGLINRLEGNHRINALFGQATQSRLVDGDKRREVRPDQKIVVYETKSDYYILQDALKLANIQALEERKTKIKGFRAKYKDRGEQSMELLAAGLSQNTPVYLISNDMRHFGGKHYARLKGHHAVCHATMVGLFNALFSDQENFERFKTRVDHVYGKGTAFRLGLRFGMFDSIAHLSNGASAGVEEGSEPQDTIPLRAFLREPDPKVLTAPLTKTPDTAREPMTLPKDTPPLSPALTPIRYMALSYPETLGYQIGYLRMQRRMSEHALAQETNQILATKTPDVSHITGELVRQWETNCVLPEPHEFLALCTVLIEQNDEIPPDAKTHAREEFTRLYQAAAASVDTPEFDAHKLQFRRELSRLRDDIELTSGQAAAKVAAAILQNRIGRPLTEYDIHAIETETARPLPIVIDAMIEALDTKAPLTDATHSRLVDLRKNSLKGNIPMGGSSEAYKQALLRPNQLRNQLLPLLPPHMTNKDLSERYGLTEGELSAFRPMHGREGAHLPFQMAENKFQRVGVELRKIIEDTASPEEREQKLAVFDQVYPQFVDAMLTLKQVASGKELARAP